MRTAAAPARRPALLAPARARRPTPQPRWHAPRPARRTATAETSTPDAYTVLTAAEAAAAEAAAATPAFDWNKQWYPVLGVSGAAACDPTRPHAVQVLGLDLVAWFDPTQAAWKVARDACPHRLAPLSEGRIDPNPKDGGKAQLLCSYHGWAWSGCGQCTRIPQSEHDPTALATALASPRTRLTMYPTTVAAGLLFVWPESDDGAAARAAAAPPPPVPTEVVANVEARGWYVRDVLYPYDILLENLLDPAHLPVSHHGLATLNRANAKPVPMVRRPPSPDDPGATIDFAIASVMAPPAVVATTSRLTFYAPTHVRYRYSQPGSPMVASTCLYATPTAPGRARVFLCDAPYKDPKVAAALATEAATAGAPKKKPAVSWATRWRILVFVARLKLLPPWFNHFSQSFIFDSDGVLLYQQGERLAASPRPWASAYYLVSSDNFVASMRAWMDRVGGGGPKFAPGAPPPPPRPLPARQALDRDTQHTALCTLCQKGRVQVKRARNVLAGVAAAAALAAAVAVGRATARPALIAAVVAAVAGAAAVALQRKVLPQFGYVGHVHAENN